MPWAVYGTYSGFHLFVNPSGLDIGPHSFDPAKMPLEDMKNQPKALVNKLRLAMLVNGVDLNPRGGGLLSCTHTARRCGQHHGGVPRGDPHAEAGRRADGIRGC